MTDLVKRLRAMQERTDRKASLNPSSLEENVYPDQTCVEAADEIARLRAALKIAEAECEKALREKTWFGCLAFVHCAVDSIHAALSPARGDDPVPADTGDGT